MVIDHRAPGLGNGCVGYLWKATDAASIAPGVDEGPVSITGTSAAVPPCTFIAGKGYYCVGGGGSGNTTVITGGALPPGTALYNIVGATFTMADVGRYLEISGDPNPTNNGTFPIVSESMGTGLVVGNPQAVLNVTPFAGTWATFAGVGPVPGGPNFVVSSDAVVVSLTSGGGMDFTSFMTTALHGVDAFTSKSALDSLPTDGTAATLGCDVMAGTCGGTISTIAIDTTDGPIPAGAPDYVMPAAGIAVAQIRCADFSNTITVPADIMGLVQQAAPTRVQTIVGRSTLFQSGALNNTNVLVGRTIAGYTTP
jgi:hypothetical protein